MKKILLGLIPILMMVASVMVSCNSCNKKSEKPQRDTVMVVEDYDGVVQDFTAGVGQIVALHKQTMLLLCNKQNYEWRNLHVLFNDSIKTETLDNLHVTDITDVFYYWNDGPWVQYVTSNVTKGMLIPARIPDVWIEDNDMRDAEIKLMPKDVLAKLKEWNGVIPPSKGMVLRLPVGPRRCNAQWVLGNMMQVIFVDAVTGEITNWNPAFPIPNVNGPLGEWP